MERGAGRKRVKRKEEKGEGWRKGRTTSTARISERRVSRIPLSPPSPRIPLVGGYRVTAIRLNLFHHKRLNKEVHSSARANPPLKKTDLPATLIGLRPPLTIIHLDLFLPFESFDERDGSFPVPLFRRILSRYIQPPYCNGNY